jgi:hypothetical protein
MTAQPTSAAANNFSPRAFRRSLRGAGITATEYRVAVELCEYAGAMAVVASAINKHKPANERGVFPMPSHAAAVDEKYRGVSFAAFVDQVVARRADAIRGREIERLRAEATAAGDAAEQAARSAAAGG